MRIVWRTVFLTASVLLLTACWGEINLRSDGSWDGKIWVPDHLSSQALNYGQVTASEDGGSYVHVEYPAGRVDRGPFSVVTQTGRGGVVTASLTMSSTAGNEESWILFGENNEMTTSPAVEFDLTVKSPGRVLTHNTGNRIVFLDRTASWTDVKPGDVLRMSSSSQQFGMPDRRATIMISSGVFLLLLGIVLSIRRSS